MWSVQVTGSLRVLNPAAWTASIRVWLGAGFPKLVTVGSPSKELPKFHPGGMTLTTCWGVRAAPVPLSGGVVGSGPPASLFAAYTAVAASVLASEGPAASAPSSPSVVASDAPASGVFASESPASSEALSAKEAASPDPPSVEEASNVDAPSGARDPSTLPVATPVSAKPPWGDDSPVPESTSVTEPELDVPHAVARLRAETQKATR